MKKLRLSFILALVSCSIWAQNWKSDHEHSRLGFRIEHMMISEVSGIFKDFEIQMNAAKSDFSDAAVALKAQVISIDTGVEARDQHLRDEDFFDVTRYPELQFQSKSISRISKRRYAVTGNLTMHGITKQITVEMTYNGTTDNPVTKKRTAGFQITAKLRRSDFSIGSKFPETLLGNEVSIVADTELQLQ